MIKKRTIVYFRVDANSLIGLGHLSRCMAIANIISNFFEPIFICQASNINIRDLFTEPYQIISLNNTKICVSEALQLCKEYFLKGSIVVLDGYNFNSDYQNILLENGCKIIYIDDTQSGHFFAHAIINPAEDIIKSAYSIEPYTKLYLGMQYAPLRKPFLNASPTRIINSIQNMFICFGGADNSNFTLKTAQACLNIDQLKKVYVVVSGNNPDENQLYDLAKSNKKLYIYKDLNTEGMWKLMQQCEIAISPSSTLSLELATCGNIILLGLTASNQIGLYNGFSKYPHIFLLGDFFKLDWNNFPSKLIEIIESISLPYVSTRLSINESNILDIFKRL